ncbi:MAG: hypothetical protein PVI68_11745 [Anaerolineae bacterium]|jgi:hypothetical protein
MFEKRVEIPEGACLALVEMAKDVTIETWDQAGVLFQLRDGQEQDLDLEETPDGPVVSARAACRVRVPPALPVAIREARANLLVKGLQAELNAEQVRANLRLDGVEKAVVAEVYGNLNGEQVAALRLLGTVYGNAALKSVQEADLQNVRGNLTARSAVRLRISRVGGNLQVKGIENALDADRVGGNAALDSIGGRVTIEQVAGNLAAKNLTGGAKIPKIGGNLTLNGALGAGRTYQFSARGNAALRLAEDASAYVRLSAKGKVLSSVDLVDQQQGSHTLSGTLGSGGTEVTVEARGNVLLGGGRLPFAGLGEEISRQVEAGLRAVDLEAIRIQALQDVEESLQAVDFEQIKQELREAEASLQAVDFEAIGQQVQQETEQAVSRLQVKLDGMDWDRIGRQTQQAIERAMSRLERDIDHLSAKAARRQEKALRRIERDQRRRERQGDADPDSGEAQPVDASEPPSDPALDLDHERLTILRMVEQGQITPQEAEMLLDALL